MFLLLGKDLFLHEKSFNFIKVTYQEKRIKNDSVSLVRK